MEGDRLVRNDGDGIPPLRRRNGASVLSSTGGSVALMHGLLLLPKEEKVVRSQESRKKKNSDIAWLWILLQQSYSRHERFLLWRTLSRQQCNTPNDFYHIKFACVRRLLEGPIRSMLRRQEQQSFSSLVLRETLAFLQDVIYRKKPKTSSHLDAADMTINSNEETSSTSRSNDTQHDAELRALFYFYWPRFCQLLWRLAQMVKSGESSPLRSALAIWSQFLYHAADAAFWKSCGAYVKNSALSPLACWMAAHYCCPRLVPRPPLDGRPEGSKPTPTPPKNDTVPPQGEAMEVDAPPKDAPEHNESPLDASDPAPPEGEADEDEGSVVLSSASSANSDTEVEEEHDDDDDDNYGAPQQQATDSVVEEAENPAAATEDPVAVAQADYEAKRAHLEVLLADPPDWMEVVDREMAGEEAVLPSTARQALDRILLGDVVDQQDEEDDDDDDDILHDDDDDEDAMELEEIQAVVAASEQRFRDVMQQHQDARSGDRNGGPDENRTDSSKGTKKKKKIMTPEQRTMYIKAAMQVLILQHQHSQLDTPSGSYLSIAAENELLGSLNQVVQPPKEPNATQILLRRAPTQEEFFRGSLRRNPIAVSSLGSEEPTVGDLRSHIAQELQMADSAELLEIIVANKIVDTQLKIRVVQQVLWKKSLMENSSNGSSGNNESSLSSLLASSSGGAALFSTGLALSLLLSHSTSRGRVTADTPLEQLPPMVAMYRLAGVDGEATEEHVTELADPEAAAEAGATPAALEAAWAVTQWVTEGRGAAVLLRSIQNHVADVLRRIRRDAVGCHAVNVTRADFQKCPPPHGLILLRHVAQLAPHRKRLLQARAPTILLALLLDILKMLEGADMAGAASSTSNPTADILQELIELLTSDISTSSEIGSDVAVTEKYEEVDQAPDASSLPLLLQSIETIALSAPLRIMIGKLLPFLTYGQPELCRELARHFDTYLHGEELCIFEKGICDDSANTVDTGKKSILVHTFVQTAISLPANDVCHSLRLALTSCVQRLALWVLQNMPEKPAPWTPALWPMGESVAAPDLGSLEEAWRAYYARPGVRTAFQVLTGLCRRHGPTQSHMVSIPGFVSACHWLETISDSSAANVQTEGLGLLAETLLDELIVDNEFARKVVESARNATRSRKKQLAQEQRQRALLKIGSFGGEAMALSNALPSAAPNSSAKSTAASSATSTNVTANRSKSRKRKLAEKKPAVVEKPAWLSEAEQMQDEVGLTCAVCQEGHTLQPSELLGLYVFMKKVTLPIDHGSPAAVTGANLLRTLPQQLPDALVGSSAAVDTWFAASKSVALSLSASSSLFSASHRNRPTSAVCTMTVTAGTGIHYGCHRRARQADRVHPKAPKSEWEGAALRNNRVRCNAILPFVAGPNQSEVPLVSMELALSEYSSTVTNTLGSAASSKSALWTILYDLRLLLLRIAYNESLSSDCGGGSLASNCQLIYYECFLIQILDRNAQMDEDQLECSLHAHGLSAGVLAATAILDVEFTGEGMEAFRSDEVGIDDSITSRTEPSTTLARYLADAATMGALTSIVFHNTQADGALSVDGVAVDELPHPKRRWILGKDYFWQALVLCAGRRHAMGITGSGCFLSTSSRSSSRSGDERSKLRGTKRPASSQAGVTMEEIFAPLRPLVVYYVILQQLSQDYSPALLSASTAATEDPLEPCVERLVHAVDQCSKSTNLAELLSVANITMDHHTVLHWFQKGMRSV